jgi:hypothetical protein
MNPKKNDFESTDLDVRAALAARLESSRCSALTGYLKGLDIAKKVVLIVMAACGLIYVIAVHRIESLPSWQEPGIWQSVEGISGVGVWG